MAFKDRIKELMSSHLEAELMEGLKHDRYMRAHGKKASGSGTWMFTTKKDGEVNYDNDKEVFQSGPSMKLGDAAKAAMKALGKTVYVMEAKLDPVGQEDDDVDNDGDVDSSDKYLKKRRAAIKKAIGTKPKLREQAKKQKAKMMPVKGSVDDANDVAQKATGESVANESAGERPKSGGPDHNYTHHVFDYTGEHGDEEHHNMKAAAKQRNVKISTVRGQKHAEYGGKHIALRGKKADVKHVMDNHIGPMDESVKEYTMIKDMVKLNASSCGKTEMYEKMKEKYGVDKATFEGLYASHCMKNEDDATARMYKDNPEMMKSKGPGGFKSLSKRAQKAVKKKMDQDRGDVNESVEDIAEGNMMSAAKELEAYARKNGGIDKNDFMKAVVMMKKGQKPQLMKFVDGLDTEPREKILTVLDDHGQLKEEVDAETVMMENLADAIENTDLSKLTVEELQEIEEGIIKALGVGAAKVASGVGKAVVGTAKLAGRAAKATVINKQGNIRGTAAAKDDAKASKLNKQADRMQKRQDAADRLKAAQDRVKSFAKPAKKPLKASYAEAFETPSNEKKLADLGRKMMDMGKKEKNDAIANAYARLGDALTRYGTTFGARNMKELEKKTGMKAAIIADLMKRAARHK
jgi:hypothetical protein